MYIKWKCKQCEDIRVSNTHRTHELNQCKCRDSFCDAEEFYTRMGGFYEHIEDYDYNFFEELVICLDEQGYEPFIKIDKLYLTIATVMMIRQLEDEIMESLI